jgi:hypothetical protein
MQNYNQLALIAVLAALALFGVVVVTVVTISQEAEARGCRFNDPDHPFGSIPLNASKGRCFNP